MLVRRFLLLLILLISAASLPAGDTIRNSGFASTPGQALAQPLEDTQLPYWHVRGSGHAVGVEYAEFSNDAEDISLVIRATEEPRATMVEQEIPAALVKQGGRLRAFARTQDIAVSASLFVVVEKDGKRIFADDMRDRPMQGTRGWQPLEISIPPIENPDTVRVGAIVVGPGTAWFDGFEWRTGGDAGEMSQAVNDYLDSALNILESRHVLADEINWEKTRQATFLAARNADSISTAHSVLRKTLASLPGNHNSLMVPKELDGKSGGSVDEASPNGLEPIVSLNDGYLLIELPGLHAESGSAVANAYVHSVLDGMDRADNASICKAILDLRGNTGGNMWPMLAAASPLFGTDDIGAHVRGNEKSKWWARNGTSGITDNGKRKVRFELGAKRNLPDLSEMPVAVLYGQATSSSGEAVAIAFKGRPRTRSFGDSTGGLTSANVAVRLEDGARLVFPVAWSADRNGKVYRGSVAADEWIPAHGDAVLQAARDWLARQDCASST